MDVGDCINATPRFFYLTAGDVYPNGFQYIGHLAEEIKDVLEPRRQELMHSVFNRAAITQIADEGNRKVPSRTQSVEVR